MSAHFAFDQQDHADGSDQNKNTNDLKRRVVIVEEQQANISDIIRCRSNQRRKFLLSRVEISNHVKNLHQQRERDHQAAGGREPVDLAQSFGAQIEQNDDEKE